MMQRFVDKVAVVTGGAKGSAAAAACVLQQKAPALPSWISCRLKRPPPRTNAAASAIRPALALHCDVTSPDSVAAAFASIVDAWGAVDILVASAGIYSSHPLAEVPFGAWQKVIDVDLTGVFLANQAAARVMLQDRPRHGDRQHLVHGRARLRGRPPRSTVRRNRASSA